MKINIGAMEVLVLLLIAVMGWAISIEVRLANATDYNSRIKNLEEIMMPMMVDWKVQKELEKLPPKPAMPVPEWPEPMPDPEDPPYDPGDDPNLFDPPKPMPNDAPGMEKMHEDAESWAEEMIQRHEKMKK